MKFSSVPSMNGTRRTTTTAGTMNGKSSPLLYNIFFFFILLWRRIECVCSSQHIIVYDEDEEIFLYQGTNFSCGGRPTTTTTAVSSNIDRRRRTRPHLHLKQRQAASTYLHLHCHVWWLKSSKATAEECVCMKIIIKFLPPSLVKR